MDADRFESLLRFLSASPSRRGALTAALGSVLGLLSLAHPDEAAAKSGTCKRKCGECTKCQKGECERKDGKRRCQKGKCQPRANGTPCAGGSCRGGRCVAAAPPPDPNACTANACNSMSLAPCGPAGAGCVCANAASAATAGAGPGRCVREPTTPIETCPAGACTAPGHGCQTVCGNAFCLQPCV